MPPHTSLVVDSFAGGGGASVGIEAALGRPVDLAINHNAAAIETHHANHPTTRHMIEDVWQVDPLQATGGRPVALLWASPDCRHFSKAKGGKPVNRRVRGLAWVVIRWAKSVRPAVIMLENVEEFQTWGPLTEDNRPCPRRRGATFRRWVSQLQSLGYYVEWRELRACDFGAPTIRKRLFIVARCDRRPIVWPTPTHGPGRTPYRTAAECIDWSLPCPSIFERKRPLAEATLRRVANGIRRYVIDAAEPFIVRSGHYSNITGDGAHFRGQPVTRPVGTITGTNDKALIIPHVTKFRENSIGSGCDEPLHTVTSGAGAVRPAGAAHAMGLVAATIMRNNHGEKPCDAAGDPLRTVTTQDNKHALVAAFLAKHFGGHETPGAPLDAGMSTVTARDHHALIAAHLTHLYTSNTNGGQGDPRQPMKTITAQGGHVAEVRAFLVKYYATARHGQTLFDPVHTLTTKHRLGLVTVAGDTYQIVDIGMRMLTPRELARAQGFGDDYVFLGSKANQVRLIGNSVCPPVAEALVRSNVTACEHDTENIA